MKTIGELLHKRRKQIGKSLDDAEGELKIRKKYLRALERDNFEALPGESYARGFVRNYSKYLGLDEEKVLAVFRRQYMKKTKQAVVPEGIVNPLNKTWFKITPQRAAVISAILVAGGVFLFLFWQYRNLQKEKSSPETESFQVPQ